MKSLIKGSEGVKDSKSVCENSALSPGLGHYQYLRLNTRVGMSERLPCPLELIVSDTFRQMSLEEKQMQIPRCARNDRVRRFFHAFLRRGPHYGATTVAQWISNPC